VALLVEVCVTVIVRMMVLLFLVTYNHLLLHEILPKVMARKLQILFLRVTMLLTEYRRTHMLQYMLVTWKCSQ
jgi:CBS domain containing-hemolysin-like protein